MRRSSSTLKPYHTNISPSIHSKSCSQNNDVSPISILTTGSSLYKPCGTIIFVGSII